MIELTRLDGRHVIINADEIEFIDSSHESAVNLKSGKVIIVKEIPEIIIEKVIEYRQKCLKKLKE